jgi:capsular exopolysaccharide synthesis family protein
MSRFYQALKGASLEPSGNGGWEALQPTAAPPGPNPEPEWVTATAAGIEVPEISAPDNVLDPLAGVAPVQEGFFGSHADVTLDQTARLIPHAVDHTVVEHYRRLRTKIMQQHATKPFRSLLVTSPNPGEGKSVTVLNLGLSFAMLPSFRVVVVDGDLRKGSLGRWLGVEQRPGLSNLLDGSAKLEDVVLKSDESPMCFVVSGTSTAAPAELLDSGALSGHFRRLGEHFDMIVVDSPPVNLITDTQLLAASCEAILLVARAFSTTRKTLEKTVQDLASFRVIGTILNGGIKNRRYGYHYGYRGY